MCSIFWNLFSAHGEIGFEAKYDLNQCQKKDEDNKVESEILESK